MRNPCNDSPIDTMTLAGFKTTVAEYGRYFRVRMVVQQLIDHFDDFWIRQIILPTLEGKWEL